MKAFIRKLSVIFIVLYAGCKPAPSVDQLVNGRASLPEGFQFDQSGLKVFATFISKNKRTMSTLYGNSLAIQAAKSGEPQILGGEVFALITWKQQADGNWYGANIPGSLLSVELLHTSFSNGKSLFKYACYQGKTLALDPDTSYRERRIAFIVSLKPSILP